MRTASILSIGDELLLGQTLDTNSRHIADELTLLGVRVNEHATLGDDQPSLCGAIRRLAAGADAVILTGGLGPTADDLTRHALAEVMHQPLETDDAALQSLRAWFADRNAPMPETNAVQALRPRDAAFMENPHGTAPGLRAAVKRPDGTSCEVFCLPGPPREMKPMLERFVLAPVRSAAGDRGAIAVRLVRTFGLGESTVAELLGDRMARTRSPLVGTTASGNVVTVRVRAEQPGADEANREAAAEAAAIATLLGPAAFAVLDRDTDLPDPLAHRVVAMLTERHERLAAVESCTGGLLGALLTAVPGSSAAFWGGWQTYANQAKQSCVGVPAPMIEKQGAVSRQVAQAMAEGGLQRADASRCLSITGIAGPAGGSEAKPAGTVWIALASADQPTHARRFCFKGGREAVREWAARSAMGMLRLGVEGLDMTLLGEQARFTAGE